MTNLNFLWGCGMFLVLEVSMPNQTTVRLPKGTKVFDGNHLLIRRCYLEAKDIVAINFDLDGETSRPRESRTCFTSILITGSPGMGSLVLRFCLLLYLLETRESVSTINEETITFISR